MILEMLVIFVAVFSRDVCRSGRCCTPVFDSNRTIITVPGTTVNSYCTPQDRLSVSRET